MAFSRAIMYSDLTDFLADLERKRLLTRISEPVSPDLEIAAVTDRACKSPGGGPARNGCGISAIPKLDVAVS